MAACNTKTFLGKQEKECIILYIKRTYTVPFFEFIHLDGGAGIVSKSRTYSSNCEVLEIRERSRKLKEQKKGDTVHTHKYNKSV